MDTKIKVLIGDRCPIFREGLCHILEDASDFEVVASLDNSDRLLQVAKRNSSDMAIVDVKLPESGGIEVAKQLKMHCSNIVIFIFGYDTADYLLFESLRAGVAAYLSRNTPIAELVRVIRSVHAGEAVFNRKVFEKAIDHILGNVGGNEGEKLHCRELQVLKLAARGMHNRQIADELMISERTVQTHLVNIFRKLAVSSRTEAVLRGLKEGWLSYD